MLKIIGGINAIDALLSIPCDHPVALYTSLLHTHRGALK
jgi:hypothetical protein